ncbi:MAG TPA: hypothetical protein PLO51_04425, partial [Candidatus Micrarchaeota archaeon]|nr:hypothetical protein [Candidatus Micrarchaeota archaeon]
MALITVKSGELERLSGIKSGKFEELLTAIGVPLERNEGGELDLEITPNRPDLLSGHQIMKTSTTLLGFGPSIT